MNSHVSAKEVRLLRGSGVASLLLVILISQLFTTPVLCQPDLKVSDELRTYREMRKYDSVIASRVPILHLPAEYYGKTLPVSVDNSKFKFFPGIYDQVGFFTCQQYSGVAYTYTYERNRLLDRDGTLPENRFPTHYTWTFMNNADKYTGVSFFYSFQVLKEQGHITADHPGQDTAQSVRNWVSGYEKYYEGMKNRIRAVYAIPTITAEGVLTLKHYLNDHLDGSSSGGVACFSASSNFQNTNVKKLPDGTPEAGKDVIIAFYPIATHGMTIIGYNDSIRFDVNGDGKFTNDIDITGDGVIDVRDWEMGAYRMANSYGTSWHDKGFSYILYRAMALDYDYPGGGWISDRGIWNHCVYVVEPDSSYEPLLTMKVSLTYNSRNRLKIMAGVASDTLAQYPEHTINFPIFSFQGGDHYMLGNDDSEESKTLEAGFDITPLLSYVTPGRAARFFLVVDERDSMHTGEGEITHCSFLNYAEGGVEISTDSENVAVNDNSQTYIRATATVTFGKPAITTEKLPVFQPSQPYHVNLEASGGEAPLHWSILKAYNEKETDSVFPGKGQQKISQEATYIPYKKFPLPFSFPFYGEKYDTVFINFYGFISFDREQLPYPYITDEESMMRRKKIISPAFSMKEYYSNESYGIWIESLPDKVTIHWETGDAENPSLRIQFALRLYPSGAFEFLYGDFQDVPQGYRVFTGYSAGDELNYNVRSEWDAAFLKGRSFHYNIIPLPDQTSITEEGELTIPGVEGQTIYEIPVRVTDANGLFSEKTFELSDGLAFSQELVCGENSLLKMGVPAYLKLSLWNLGSTSLTNLMLKLASGDTSVTVTDSIVLVNSLAPDGSFDIEKAFGFQLTSPRKDHCPVDLAIIATSGDHTWKKSFIIRVSAPEITIPSIKLYDGCDGLLDPGEVAALVPAIKNSGSLYAENVEIAVISGDSLVSVRTLPQTIGRINSLEEIGGFFEVSASRSAPVGYTASMSLTLTDHQSVNLEIPFTLSLGKVPVAVVGLSADTVSYSAMKSALDSLSVPYSSFTSLPSHPELYSGIFVASGTGTACHMVTEDESVKLVDFLNDGGNLYLEVSPAWYYYYQAKTDLNPMLKYSSKKIPICFYNSVEGVPESLTDGIYFDYTNPNNHSIYDFQPVSPAAVIFQNSDSLAMKFQITYKGPVYKTISSLIEFGYLADGVQPSDKVTLMRRYLDFFNIETAGPRVFFHGDRTMVCRWDTVHFIDDSYDNISSWSWEFPGGTPTSSDIKDPVVTYVDQGRYDVSLTVSDGANSRTMIKKEFIEVQVCAGTHEPACIPGISVYPNPASGDLHIIVPGWKSENTILMLYDLMGRIVLTRNFGKGTSEKDIVVDISSLNSGLYILKVIAAGNQANSKVVIQ
jgi:hypothetical protein